MIRLHDFCLFARLVVKGLGLAHQNLELVIVFVFDFLREAFVPMVVHDLQFISVEISFKFLIKDARLNANDPVLQSIVVDLADKIDASIAYLENFLLDFSDQFIAEPQLHFDVFNFSCHILLSDVQ